MTASDPRARDAPGGPPEQPHGSGPRVELPAVGHARSWTQSLTSSAPVPGPAGFFYADIPNRLVAYIIDAIALGVLGLIVALVLGGPLGGVVASGEGAIDGAGGDLHLLAFLVVGLGHLALSFAYLGYSWTAFRGTPGMMLLGLQVGDERDGRSIGWDQALRRWLALGIPSVLAGVVLYVSAAAGFLISLVGLVWLSVLLYSVARSPTRQGIHDRYARTIVVKADRRLA